MKKFSQLLVMVVFLALAHTAPSSMEPATSDMIFLVIENTSSQDRVNLVIAGNDVDSLKPGERYVIQIPRGLTTSRKKPLLIQTEAIPAPATLPPSSQPTLSESTHLKIGLGP